jgi:pilus assembly protein CpaF
VVRLLTRKRNVEGSGEVALPELVRQALRMRPDRIVLGECRGAEVREVLTALNTGHEGGWATLHANTAADVPARLEALAALAGMDRSAVAAQVASAVDAVVHLRRVGDRRRLAEIGVVERAPSGEVHVVTAMRVQDGPGPGWSRRVTGPTDGGESPEGAAGVVTGAGWPVLERRLRVGGGGR